MTLSLTLSAVSAEDAVSDDIVAADDVAVAEEAPAIEADDAGGDEIATEEDAVAEDEIVTEVDAAGGDVAAADPVPIEYVDVATDVMLLDETPLTISWGILVTNYGPDVAKNTVTRIGSTQNMMLYNLAATAGFYNLTTGEWHIRDLAPGEIAILVADLIKIDEGPYGVEALTVTDSFDYNLANNYDVAWADAEPASVSAGNDEKTMPAAGNPIAMALLALIAIAGTTISRRF